MKTQDGAKSGAAIRHGAATGSLRLTERDEALLVDLFRHGAMLRGQIADLHFPEVGLRRVNRRLQTLSAARFVAGSPLPFGPLSILTPASAPGACGQWVYQLSARGIALVAARLGVDIDLVRKRVRRGTPTALAHALEIVQCQIALADLSRTSGDKFRLLEFAPEIRHAWQVRPEGSEAAGRQEAFRPDAHVRFALDGAERHAFIEVDLGHTSTENWEVKFALSERFVASGIYQRRYGECPFQVWALTTTSKRALNLCRLAERAGASGYRFTTLSAFADPGPLSGIFLRQERFGLSSLLEGDTSAKEGQP